MKKVLAVIFVLIAIVGIYVVYLLVNRCEGSSTSNPEVDGYVPDEETAIKIAEAVWLPIYGENVKDEKPFHASLKNDSIWIVEGTLHTELGGVARAEIQKRDGKILRVIHGK